MNKPLEFISVRICVQDPVLFGRSMRKNLDPFSDHTDPQLWNALEKVRKWHVFRNSFATDIG